MMLKIIFNFTIILLFFVGCGGSNNPQPAEINKTKTLPTWYINESKDTHLKMYSSSIGKNKKDAISNALIDIVSRLSISVESEFQADTKVSGKSYNKEIKKTIKTKVNNIKINNYEVLNSKRISYNKYLIKISIDKSKLSDYLQAKVNKKFNLLLEEEKAISNSNPIVQQNKYNLLIQSMNDIVPKLYVIKSLDQLFEDKKYFKTLDHFQKQYLKLKYKTNLYVYAKKADKNFTSKLKTYLLSYNINIRKKSNTDLYLRIDTNKSIVNNEYFKMVIYKAKLKLYYKKVLVGENIIEIKTHNKGNHNRISEKASSAFYSKIKDKTLFELMNLK